jgi:hypothetical protein
MQKQFAKIMALGFIIFGVIFAFTVTETNPGQGATVLIPFYISFLLGVTCLFSLLSFYARRTITNNELHYASIKVSFRQSSLLAFFLTLTLFLASIKLLTWWDVILLAFSTILFELYFESNKVKPPKRVSRKL